MTIKTDELRTSLIENLVSPAQLAEQIPLSQNTADFIMHSRREIEAIIKGDDKRLLVIIGPCSIHDTSAAIDYAKRLKKLRDKYANELLIVMRVYFEKPRTTVGWKGLISDPDLDKTFTHPEHGKVFSIIENIGIYAWHCNHHLAHITTLKKSKQWEIKKVRWNEKQQASDGNG